MIEIRHLRYFIVVAEELNFRRAAERVLVHQSPLSRAIRDLEEQLGVRLLSREARRLCLTPAGIRLYAEANKILSRIERAKRAVREADASYRVPLRLGIADSIAQTKLTQCLSGWRTKEPDTPLELIEMGSEELRLAVRQGSVEAGFSFGISEIDGLHQEPAWSYPMVAVLPLTHALAHRDVLTLPELLASPMVACCPVWQAGRRVQMDAILQRYAVKPNIACEARSIAGYVTRVAAGLGVGLTDADHMKTLRRTDVVFVPIAEAVNLVTYVVHRSRRSTRPDALARFLAHAKSLP